MAYDSYKLTQSSSSSTPQNQMLYDKSKQVRYLYDLAMDRENGCLLNNVTFIESPRIFNRKETGYSEVINVETINTADKFVVGDYLTFDNAIWLCTKSYIFHGLYCRGIFMQCNYTLKFQHPTTGVILSYPCIDETSSSVGIDENNTISTINNIHRIKLPFDDSTKLIKIDDRFFLDRVGTTTYKTTNVNNTEFSFGSKGIIELTLQADGAYNLATDKNGVCNYFSPTVTPEPTPVGSNYSKITSSGDIIIDNTRTVTAIAYNSDNTVNSSVSLTWVITKPSGYENDITCTVVGNTCTVVVKENYDLIDLVIKFDVSDGSGGYVGSKEFTVGV